MNFSENANMESTCTGNCLSDNDLVRKKKHIFGCAHSFSLRRVFATGLYKGKIYEFFENFSSRYHSNVRSCANRCENELACFQALENFHSALEQGALSKSVSLHQKI